MSIESVDTVDVWRRPESFARLGAALMHANEVVAAQEPPDAYAREYALRLREGLVAANRDTIPYIALRRPEALSMTFRYGSEGAPGVHIVDMIVTEQLANLKAA